MPHPYRFALYQRNRRAVLEAAGFAAPTAAVVPTRPTTSCRWCSVAATTWATWSPAAGAATAGAVRN